MNDYPVPDPNWDYSNPYHRMQQARKKLEEAIAQISEAEEATPDYDRILEGKLYEIRELLHWKGPINRYKV